MNSGLIIGLTFGGGVALVSATFIDRHLKEINCSEKFRKRKFKLTYLELILYGLYLLFFFSYGIFIIYGGFFLFKINPFLILLSLLGIPLTLNFLLFLNHLFYETLQTVSLQKRDLLIVKRFNKEIIIHLKHEETRLIHYKPRWEKSYTSRGFKIFGAGFSKTVIYTSKHKVSFSSLLLKDYKHLSMHMKPENAKTVKKQLNFIF